jgi:hypothetical protein
MKRWDFLEKDGEYFMGAKAAPADFYILYDDNKCLAAFCRNLDETWLVIFNGEFAGWRLDGMCRTKELPSELTILEAKAKVEELCATLSGKP